MGKGTNKIIQLNANKAPAYDAVKERENNAVGSRIEEALHARGLSQKGLTAILNTYGLPVTNHAVSKWAGGVVVPNAYQLLAICHALQIEDGLSYFTKDFKPALNEEGLRKVETYREDLIASGNYKPQAAKIHYIDMPVSSLAVSAGTGAFLDEGNFDMVSFPENTVPAKADFGLRVSGNSMEPVYHDGQIVWVHQCAEVAPGQVGVFVCDGEGFLKVYSEQEPEEKYQEDFTDSYGNVRMQPVLVSYNQDYPDRPISPNASFQVVGQAL